MVNETKRISHPVGLAILDALGIVSPTLDRNIAGSVNFDIQGKAKTGRGFDFNIKIQGTEMEFGYGFEKLDLADPKNSLSADQILAIFCRYLADRREKDLKKWFPSDKPRIVKLGKWDIEVNYEFVSIQPISYRCEAAHTFKFSWKEGKR